MAERLTLAELTSMMSNPDVPEEQLKKYFRAVPNPERPFAPTIIVDPMLIDIGAQAEARLAQDWIVQAALERRQKKYRRKIDAGWDGLRFVSEGDSWFQYPSFLWVDGSDVIDYLFDRYAIFCSAFAGDTLHNIVDDLSTLERHIAAENASALLFSAGGNDLAGRDEQDDRGVGLGRFIRGYAVDRDAEDYVNNRYSSFLRSTSDTYKRMIDRLLTRFPDLKIFYHGYDRAYPRWRGTWLYPALHEKEVPEELWHGVVSELIDRFNETLIALAAQYPGHVYHVDCRGAIGGKGEWRDELHGKAAGCERAAKRFQEAIDRAFTAAA